MKYLPTLWGVPLSHVYRGVLVFLHTIGASRHCIGTIQPDKCVILSLVYGFYNQYGHNLHPSGDIRFIRDHRPSDPIYSDVDYVRHPEGDGETRREGSLSRASSSATST